MQGSLLPAALLSSDFRIIAVNDALAALVDVSASQLRRKTILDVVDERDREGVRSFLSSALHTRDGAVSQRELRLAPARDSLLVVRRAGGAESPRLLLNIVDLTTVAATQLDRAAQDWRTTFDAVEMPIVIVGHDLSVLRMNRAARMLAGMSHDEVTGASLRDFPPSEPWLAIADLATRARESRSPGAHQVKDSSGRTLDLLAMPFDAQNLHDERAIVIAWDVSALVDLQSTLEQQRQMAAMGALVAGVAHEVRNPLFAISATIDALEQQASGSELNEYFEVLREEIDRMTRLMQELLAYGRPVTPVFTEVPIEDIVQNAVRACSSAAAKQGVAIDVSASADFTIYADRDRLGRAVENLLMNAIQHSPPGGSVAVAASREESDSSVVIRVRDQGRGFATEDLARVFEPFFSRRKGGTGLGLALVRQIVTEHGGEVSAMNAPGGGAEVVMTIPAKRTRAA